MRARPRDEGESSGTLSFEEDRHVPFLMYRRFFYLKIAAAAVIVAVIIYLADVPYGEPYGGTWAGYTLGTAGALLILWLLWFGYRKRVYRKNEGKLEAWLSAHVYLGLALLVIATLHTGFHFGWNIHTAAYALMCLVIASGAFGIYCYVHYPRLMTENRAGTTMPQLLARLAVLDDELHAAAMTLDDESARLVLASVEASEVGGSAWRQLSGRLPDSPTVRALAGIDAIAARSAEDPALYRRIRVRLDEKAQLLARVRRDIGHKAMMDVWLYFHVPLSFALLAALTAHIISVFFYF